MYTAYICIYHVISHILSALLRFSMTHEVRCELNCPEGWPQFSVVLTGDASSVAAARAELPAMLKPFDLEIPGPKAKAEAAASAEPEAVAEVSTVEVDGLVMKSMERPKVKPQRERRSMCEAGAAESEKVSGRKMAGFRPFEACLTMFHHVLP